jgi:hypothetical protein
LSRRAPRRLKAAALAGTALTLAGGLGSAGAAAHGHDRPATATTVAAKKRAPAGLTAAGRGLAGRSHLQLASALLQPGALTHPKAARHAVKHVAKAPAKPARPAPVPPQDQLLPVATTGPQEAMPISAAQYRNATTIVRETADRHMGARSAVIAVATAMQESRLLNLGYGDADSLGLFQQRPSAGWGTPAEIMTPSHAAGEFLRALRQYQDADPGWATRPLWSTAQAVQASGYPLAYAQWETQAASLVQQITHQHA